jgi:hypothetical protein
VTYFGAAAIGVLSFVSQKACEALMKYVEVDDVVSAISVHGAPGLVGTLALGFLATETPFRSEGCTFTALQHKGLLYGGDSQLLWVQCVGCAALAAWCASTTWLFLTLISFFVPLRQSRHAEIVGSDKMELGMWSAEAKVRAEEERCVLNLISVIESLRGQAANPFQRQTSVLDLLAGARWTGRMGSPRGSDWSPKSQDFSPRSWRGDWSPKSNGLSEADFSPKEAPKSRASVTEKDFSPKSVGTPRTARLKKEELFG